MAVLIGISREITPARVLAPGVAESEQT